MGSNLGLTLFITILIKNSAMFRPSICYILFLIMIQTDCNTMEAKEEYVDVEKGCCRHVDIIKAKYNNAKDNFWFKKISQIFTLFSTLWMFGTK